MNLSAEQVASEIRTWHRGIIEQPDKSRSLCQGGRDLLKEAWRYEDLHPLVREIEVAFR